MRSFKLIMLAAATGLALSASAFTDSALARRYDDDVTHQCAQIVGKIYFSSERNKDRMLNACMENGGEIPH